MTVSRDPVSENSGRYTCSVVNEVGAAMAMSHVTILSGDNMGLNLTQVSFALIVVCFYFCFSDIIVWILAAKVLFCLNHGAVGYNKV